MSRRRKPTSLRTHLLIVVASAVIGAVTVSLLVAAVMVRQSVERTALSSLDRQADLLAAREQSDKQPTDFGLFLTTQQEKLSVLSRSQASLLLPGNNGGKILQGQPVHGKLTLHGERYFYAARPSGPKAIVLLRSAKLQEADWHPFALSLLLAGIVGIILSTLAALAVARSIAGPIQAVAQAAEELAQGHEPRELPQRGVAEVVLLADSFNDLAHKLAHARDAERTFLLSVSHELKTPLTAIRGHAEGLIEQLVEPTAAGEVIEHESQRLERLVADLLDLARLNQSSFQIKTTTVDLLALAQEAVQRYELSAHNFDVNVVLLPQAPATAEADPDRVLQVLSNLIENALRVTPAGGQVSITASPGRLVVGDTGPGLELVEVDHAFERFFLYNRYAQARRVGTGLGLAIVKELVDAMQGTIDVESTPGHGTRFIIDLPQETPAPAAAEPAN